MPITLVETFRAIFYAPFYAAHALGAWRAEGLDVRLETAASTAVTGGLLSADADVSWGGPMRLLFAHDRDRGSDLVGFCEVVTRDPFVVVGREPKPGFRPSDLAGLRFAAVSEVPTPWLCLQDDLRRAGVDPAAVRRLPDRPMADNAQALCDGAADAAQLCEPFVERLVRGGAGHVWYAAAERGPTSYTTLFTTRPTLRERRGEMLAMTRALYRTQKWLHGQDAPAIADAIAGFFPDLTTDLLAACIARYVRLGVWGRNPLLPRGGFERLRAACLSGGLIGRGAAYEDCIDAGLARAVIDEDPPPLSR